jgi:AraC-like DNA-binding protein
MHYQLFKPHDTLHPYISCYWLLDTHLCPAKTRQIIIPDGYSELIFNLGSGYSWRIDATDHMILKETVVLIGQRTQSVTVDLSGAIRQIGVKLKPPGLLVLCRDRSDLFQNQMIVADEVSQSSLQNLAETLNETPAFPDAVRLLDTYFLNYFSLTSPDVVVRQAMNSILMCQGNIRIDTLLLQLQVSYKVLENRFRTHVGISPKEFSRIIRFKNSYRALVELHPSDPYFYLDYGFYDQSHFIKEFKYFMRQSPTAYLTGTSQAGDAILRWGPSAWANLEK